MVTADILIVGGGPAGAAAGTMLARAGFDVVICEQKKFPRRKVCGEFMAPRSRDVLARVGVLEAVDRLSGPAITRLVAHASEGPGLRAPLPADGEGNFPRALQRDILDDLLLNAARDAGARVLQPVHVHSISKVDGFFSVITSQDSIRARAVILAHGLVQRGDLDPSSPSTPISPFARKKYLCFKAHFTNCALASDTIAIGGAAGAYIGLVRTGCDLPAIYSLAFVMRHDIITPRAQSPEDRLAGILKQNPGFRRMLASASLAGPWLASGPLDPGVRTIYSDGRFFVGNAAGEVHALVGEGITLALRGAAILADTFQRHGLNDLDAAGRAYEASWRREFSPRYHAANVFANLMMRPSIAGAAAMILDSCPPLLDYCIVRSGKW